MGQIRRIPVHVEVRAVAGFLGTVVPESITVDKGGSQEAFRFVVTATPEAGYDKPIYLDVEGMAGNWSFDVNPIPPGGGISNLDADFSGFPVGGYDFNVVVSEDVPEDFVAAP